jgi:hypothetical protein
VGEEVRRCGGEEVSTGNMELNFSAKQKRS